MELRKTLAVSAIPKDPSSVINAKALFRFSPVKTILSDSHEVARGRLDVHTVSFPLFRRLIAPSVYAEASEYGSRPARADLVDTPNFHISDKTAPHTSRVTAKQRETNSGLSVLLVKK
jgi:hypothetical protein